MGGDLNTQTTAAPHAISPNVATAGASEARASSKPRALLFDLDGTLHDKPASDARLAAHLHTQHQLASFSVDREHWRKRFVELHALALPKPEVFRRLAAEFGLSSRLVEALAADFDRDYRDHVVAMPGAEALLDFASHAGWKLGLITNGRDAMQRSKVAGLGWSARFGVILTSGGFGKRKPAPDIFLAAIGTLQVRAVDTIVIGDNFAHDIEPALALGMRAIWKSKTPTTDPRLAFCSNPLAEIERFLRVLI